MSGLTSLNRMCLLNESFYMLNRIETKMTITRPVEKKKCVLDNHTYVDKTRTEQGKST